MEKDWEARFRVPPSTDRTAIFIVLTLVAIIALPLFWPIHVLLLLGLLPSLSVRFIMRKLGRTLNMLGVAAIAIWRLDNSVGMVVGRLG
jgi:hypothetical protein